MSQTNPADAPQNADTRNETATEVTPSTSSTSNSETSSRAQVQQLTDEMGQLTVDGKANTTEESAEEQKQEEGANHEEPEEYFTRDLIDISKTTINFNRNMLYPGSIDQVQVVIGLKDEILPDEDPKAAYLLRVIAVCHNSEFNDLDEYVFSVRSNERFEYFEEVRFRIRKRERAQVRVAVKVPVVKDSYVIEGTLSVQLENTVPIFLQIYAKCEMPKIVCLKDLYKEGEHTHVIKIPAKKNMRIPPIPFKNVSAYNLVLQVETVTSEDFSDRAYDIISQNTVNCMANSPFFVNLQLKTNMNYKGVMPKSDTIRKVLILKVKNSTVHYNYPIEAYVFESSAASNVS